MGLKAGNSFDTMDRLPLSVGACRTMQVLAVPQTMTFGPFVLDLGARALLAGGERLALSSRAFDILALLVSERDRVVSKDEILATVWRGVAVEENNLAVQMSALRRVLAEHAAGQTMILTVPGQGYRFVARLERPEGPEAASLPQAIVPPPPEGLIGATAQVPKRRYRVWMVAAAALAACMTVVWLVAMRLGPGAAPRLSIAVLPFRNLGDDRSQDYLADAISDDLTTDLSHLPGSVVIARESSDVYKGRAVPAERIGRELNVRYLLEGSLRGVDGIFHVNAQLIDARNGGHLWAEAFDVPRSQISDAQAAIVRNIAGALDVQLVAIESERSRRERQDNPDAFDLYLQARSIADTAQSLDQLKAAQDLFERSIRLQPDNVDAMADLSLLLLEKSREHDDPDDSADRARANALIAQALSLSPNNVTALTARGVQLNLDRKLLESEASLRAALELDPTNLLALTRLAQDEWRLGKPPAAAEIIQKILQLDPKGPEAKKRMASLGMAYFMEGKFQDSIETLLRSLAGEASGASAGGDRIEFSNMFLIAAYDRIGDRQRAQELYAQYRQHWPHRSVWRLCGYFSKAQVRWPGFKALVEGLQDAGMPEFEHMPARMPASLPAAAGGDFEVPPTAIAGARAIEIGELSDALKERPRPVLLDFGSGAATLENAIWIPFPDDAHGGLSDHLAQIPPSQPIIVVGSGFYGTNAQTAVPTIIASGHGPVRLLSGGEEALAASGYPTVDRRTP
jgi:TolB-like protein/DNA-binding winged helix-turn-helix (wHTH) protein/cytochrome c-type biogenesis protein CcmH/NrfG